MTDWTYNLLLLVVGRELPKSKCKLSLQALHATPGNQQASHYEQTNTVYLLQFTLEALVRFS